jgi:ubiquitin
MTVLLCRECQVEIRDQCGGERRLILCEKCKAELKAEIGVGPRFAYAESLRGPRGMRLTP